MFWSSCLHTVRWCFKKRAMMVLLSFLVSCTQAATDDPLQGIRDAIATRAMPKIVQARKDFQDLTLADAAWESLRKDLGSGKEKHSAQTPKQAVGAALFYPSALLESGLFATRFSILDMPPVALLVSYAAQDLGFEALSLVLNVCTNFMEAGDATTELKDNLLAYRTRLYGDEELSVVSCPQRDMIDAISTKKKAARRTERDAALEESTSWKPELALKRAQWALDDAGYDLKAEGVEAHVNHGNRQHFAYVLTRLGEEYLESNRNLARYLWLKGWRDFKDLACLGYLMKNKARFSWDGIEALSPEEEDCYTVAVGEIHRAVQEIIPKVIPAP